jgi:hypothetical protein
MKTKQPLTSRTLFVARNFSRALLAQDVTHRPSKPKHSTTSVTPNKVLLTKLAFGYSTTNKSASRVPTSRISVQNSSTSIGDKFFVAVFPTTLRFSMDREPLMADFVPNTKSIMPLV